MAVAEVVMFVVVAGKGPFGTICQDSLRLRALAVLAVGLRTTCDTLRECGACWQHVCHSNQSNFAIGRFNSAIIAPPDIDPCLFTL